MTGSRLVAFRCDLSPVVGAGHAMRSMALGEEFVRRGNRAVFVCNTAGLPWVSDRLVELGVSVVPDPPDAAELPRLFERLSADLVVFDSYTLPTWVYKETRALGCRTMAFVDGTLRGAEADVLLDQNLGAENDIVGLPSTVVHLAGAPYAVLRDDVISRRPETPPSGVEVTPPRVFAFFGGTDVLGAGPVVVQALADTGFPFEATLVAPRESLRKRIDALLLHAGQRVRVIGPTDQVPDLIRESDFVVCAGGTSIWETFALGAAVGVVCLAENQRLAYRRVVDSGAAVGVGMLSEIQTDATPAVASLLRLLADHRLRGRLSAAGWQLIDGHGKRRVVDVLEASMSPSKGVGE